MGRLDEMFERLRGSRAALIAYATGFYPDRDRCADVIEMMLSSGADVVEIGIPFSDPVMDGPVIQQTSSKALEAGATPAGVLDLVSSVRGGTEKPMLAMTYYNPVFHYGLEAFARDAKKAGVDGLVVPDLPAEEMGPLVEACRNAGLATVAFASTTTTDARIEQAAAMSTGFLYCVSLLGTTGERESLPDELPGFLSRVREHSQCPIAAGIGISNPGQCAEVGKMADGVIVGSAFMRSVIEGDGDLSGLSKLVGRMARALNDSAR